MPRGLIPEAFVQQSELVVWSEAFAASCKHDDCAICHEPFSVSVPDICRVLDCSHVFHAKCVDLWFIKATFCPLCKSDLKVTFRYPSQRSLGRSSHESSQLSLGERSHTSSLRSGQILVGHSNSDPALLRILTEHPQTMGLAHMGILHRSSPPLTPDRQHGSAASLPIMGSSMSARSIGLLSSSSSGALPAVQEISDEARFADGVGEDRSASSNPPSPDPEIVGFQVGSSEGHVAAESAALSQSAALSSQLAVVVQTGLDQDVANAFASSDLQASGCTGTSERTRRVLVPRNSSWITSRSNVAHPARRREIPPRPGGSVPSDAGAPRTRVVVPHSSSGSLELPTKQPSLMRHRSSSVPPASSQEVEGGESADKLGVPHRPSQPAGSAAITSGAASPPVAFRAVASSAVPSKSGVPTTAQATAPTMSATIASASGSRSLGHPVARPASGAPSPKAHGRAPVPGMERGTPQAASRQALASPPVPAATGRVTPCPPIAPSGIASPGGPARIGGLSSPGGYVQTSPYFCFAGYLSRP